MDDFPQPFESSLKTVAERRGFKVLRYEYWGVPISEIVWKDGGLIHRVQFDLREKDIGVTRKAESAGKFSAFLRWCRNSIPMFPFAPKISHWVKPGLLKTLTEEQYLKEMERAVENHV